jgi:hypothetical protein
VLSERLQIVEDENDYFFIQSNEICKENGLRVKSENGAEGNFLEKHKRKHPFEEMSWGGGDGRVRIINLVLQQIFR